ncbi:(2,3-dihydroxybenzoyl)adenylate synthase [Streptomyces sp. NBC_00385]|uniref:(2,3-dihydroxybenzoyl)adenylate synthase n=1 Tax=Streptomyces sp. NBC_00385 TaxID=2975733 RepID=UPI002DD818C2|nr:AMP-binding protein [Streptomyces sp. NBC_00385]WRZ04103.1 AMP-binding protein [Streptomyces sp. NBC_00385]
MVLTAWPAESVAMYRREGLWQGTPLGRLPWLLAAREQGASHTVLTDEEGAIGAAELARRCDALADGFAAHGLRPGDNVLVQLPNFRDLFLTLFACARLGVRPVLLLPAHREHEVAELADLARAAAIIVPGRWRGHDHEAMAHTVAAGRPALRRVFVAGEPRRTGSVPLRPLTEPGADPDALRGRLDAAAPDPGDIALFLLSGGTTGTPKLIPRTHDDYLYNARRSAEICGFGEDTVYLCVLPASHNFPLACPGVLGALIAGGRAVLTASPEPKNAFARIRDEGVTVTAVVPAVAQRWMTSVGTGESDVRDLAGLELIQVGGAPLAPSLARRIAPVLGCRLQQVFGMAEGLLCYTRQDDPEELVTGSQGRPLSDRDELLVVDGEGRPVAPGSSGELWTRGPYTIRGYYRAPEHNARAFAPDGWYRTGDVVTVLPSGHVVVEGRVKDLINRGGEKISAKEVEDLLYGLPQVQQVAAVGASDDELGERVAVCVVLHPGTTLGLVAIREFFNARGVARYKIPERLELFTALPLTAVGKPDKKALAAELAARTAEPR